MVADPAAGRPLPGAREEAVLLGDLFERFNAEQQSFAAKDKRKRRPLEVQYKLLIGPLEARRIEVIKELTREHYDVLHFAGHCSHNPQDPSRSGWVFGVDANGQEELLTAREIDRIDKVPAFVFSNACESGVSPTQIGNYSPDLCPAFAEAFFRQGVQNFLGTGWPVGDRAARRFAWELYSGLLGVTAIDADSNTTINEDKSHDQDTSRNEETSEPETEKPTVALNILPISEALQMARQALIAEACRRMCPQRGTAEGTTNEEQTTEHEPDNLHLAVEHLQTWGAYQFYGNPEFRLLAAPSSTAADETARGETGAQEGTAASESSNPARSGRLGSGGNRSASQSGPARLAGRHQRLASALPSDRGGATRAGGPPSELRREDALVLSEMTIDA
ncbi:MAG: CHAT domain-containing protein, partial [Planctomycetaceae bacterium]